MTMFEVLFITGFVLGFFAGMFFVLSLLAKPPRIKMHD